jgi:uncharacterized protein (DUF58 family)
MPVSIRKLRAQAEAISAPLPPLLVAADRVAATVAQGVHGRRRTGQGETFWQFRGYEAGDPPQLIDWRQSGKSDRVFVRELEWEAAQSIWLWRDNSASMAWHSADELPEKRERAELLLLALASLLVRAGEHVALLDRSGPPRAGRGTLTRMALEMEREHRLTDTSAEPGRTGLPPVRELPRNAEIVLIGDFLCPPEDIANRVRHFAANGIHGHIVQVLDPAEESLPYHGRVRFEGLEGEPDWLLSRVEGVRNRYLARLSAQRESLSALAVSAGWSLTLHSTDHTPEATLLALYQALNLPREKL